MKYPGIKSIKQFFLRMASSFPKPYPPLVTLVKYFDQSPVSPNVLYFGDSVVERVSWKDQDTRSLGRMVSDALSNKVTVLCVSHSAYHFKIFYYLLRSLERMRNKPELVIFPVNMRSFSPQWDLNPNWQFEDEIAALKKYMESPDKKIPYIRENTENAIGTAYRDTKVVYPFSKFSHIGEFSDLIESTPIEETDKHLRKKNIFIFHYLHRLVDSHVKLSFLVRSLEFLKDHKMRALLYITPVNYQAGVRYVGTDFLDVLRDNVNILSSTISSFTVEGVGRLYDYEESFSSDLFFHDDEPTEHLNQFGRQKLAEMLAGEITRTLDCD